MRTLQRNIRNNLALGQTSWGVAVQLPSPDIVEIVGWTGYDFAWIDAEHGGLDLSEIRDLVRAADASGIDSIVRVPNKEETYIGRVLDMGATGVMIPQISSVEQGKAVVGAAHYGPDGVRGACPCGRAVGHATTDWVADSRRSDRDVIVLGIIEDGAGVQNVEAIAAECGFDGLLFGPFDYAISQGLEGDIENAGVLEMQRRVIRATRNAGIEYFSANAEWESGLEESRASMVAVTGDRFSMVELLRSKLTALKSDRLVLATAH